MLSYEDWGFEYTRGGELDISGQQLDSLEGCPQHITGSFDCSGNNLSNLVGGPQIVDGDYNCDENYNLTDLTGCASHITGRIYWYNTRITSLVGIHKIIKSCKSVCVDTKKITQGGIGLLMIENLKYISNYKSEPFEIINKYVGAGMKGMMACSKELNSRGYADYAKL